MNKIDVQQCEKMEYNLYFPLGFMEGNRIEVGCAYMVAMCNYIFTPNQYTCEDFRKREYNSSICLPCPFMASINPNNKLYRIDLFNFQNTTIINKNELNRKLQ